MTTKRNEPIGKDSVSIKCYYKDLRKLELLSGEDQIKLAIKAKQGDRKALNKLVESNLRFVLSVAKEYQQTSNLPIEDLISEGNLGLIKAVGKYDESKGVKFISYAVWWIRQSIMQAIYETGGTVRLPVNRINTLNRINRAREILIQDLGREPSVEEISKLTELSTKDIQRSYSDGNFNVSLDKKASHDSEITLEDTLEGEGLEELESGMNKDSMREEIDNVLSSLGTREKEILKMYFGLDGEESFTFREIGDKFKLTTERVRQLKEQSLRKLRQYNKSVRLREFLNNKL